MLSLDGMLRQLAIHRPIFHSEIDFQLALAQQIRTTISNASIESEVSVRTATGTIIHLDLLVRCEDSSYPIELKYKTDKTTANVNGQQFSLQIHSDSALYDFLKDVKRLEEYVVKDAKSIGYAIFLSNDPFYWEPVVRRVREFSIHHGRVVKGGEVMRSKRRTGESITCQFDHTCSWKDYSTVPGATRQRGQFKYLLLPIQKPQPVIQKPHPS